MPTPKVEILHGRDPDSSCELTVFVDGARVESVDVIDIDPGRGYERETWDENVKFQLSPKRGRSEAFRAAASAEYESFSGSQYIEDER